MPKNDYLCKFNLIFFMRKIFVFITLLFPFVLSSQNLNVSGIQEGVWNYDTIFVVGDVVVPEDKSLTIKEGSKVIFEDYYNILVKGTFEAVGSANDSIYFTISDTTGFHIWDSGKGGWNAITFQDVKNTVRLRYCHFSYGKAVDDNRYGGALRFFNTDNVEINNCTFSNNFTSGKGAALYAINSNFKIKNCEVNDNLGYNGDGEYMHGGGFQFLRCDVVMEDMYFHDNYCESCYGGGVNFDSCNVNVNKAIFEDNYAVNAGGMGIQRSNHLNTVISNILFNNNIAYHYGGAMAMATSSPLVQNVTMANNYCIAAGGGALQFLSEARPIFKNCIIWGNDWYGEHGSVTDGSQIFIWGSDCEPEFYHSVLEGGYKVIHGYSNITVYDKATMIEDDPLFIDTANRNFQLSYESPAINSGTADTTGLIIPPTDLAGNPRVIGDRIDMGCYESDATSLKEINTDIKNINIYPNPINSNSICEFILKNKSNVNAKIYNQKGSLMYSKHYGMMPSGMNEISLKDFIKSIQKDNNIYFLIIETEKETLNVKFIH